MDVVKFLMFAAAVLAGGYADRIVCYTYGSHPHCSVDGGTFRFTDAGYSNQPSSRCAQNYLITVNPLGRGESFYCNAHMDVPEQYKRIYSFSHDPTLTDAHQYTDTPLLYGEGLDAIMIGEQGDEMYLPKAHRHPDDNHYSWVDYEIANNKLTVSVSNGQYLQLSSTNLFNPNSNTTYIGVNRFYSTSGVRGSGVCRFECRTLSSSNSNRQSSDGRVDSDTPQSSDAAGRGSPSAGRDLARRGSRGRRMKPLTGEDGEYEETLG